MKVTGDMTISFPATIIPLLLKQTNPTVLKFDVRGTNSLDQIIPNKNLVEKYVVVIQTSIAFYLLAVSMS